ncbi:hypothetical protein E3P86_00070 [Wallemia ichthyophaga]|uniref:B(0,+)-type amino acid transporter 1 n=1 Tax=Wallemia ichthyophaga TaxID=245174 RepID=A0A4T0JRN9_WALIC|nr:hypothetical protein E3P86_00070 [Wallemia ichthyophaga]
MASQSSSQRSHHSRQRATSVSNAFAINPIPLLSSSEDNDGASGNAAVSPSRTIGRLGGVSLVFGMIVGSGIFSSPGNILSLTGSPGASLVTWAVGGLLAWMGASCFAELGTALPVSGGPVAYLSYAYGPLTSFTFTFTSISIIKPSGAALIATIFGEYLSRFFWLLPSTADSVPSTDDIPSWLTRLIACAGVVIVSALNMASTPLSTTTQTLFMLIKILAIIFVVVLGIVAAVRGGSDNLAPSNAFTGTNVSASSTALALYSALWAFDGWDQSNYVAGEMINVQRSLPFVIHVSMPLTIIIFLLANMSYLIAMPVSQVAMSNTVALDLGNSVLGKVGSGVATILISISALGALNSGALTTSRLISSVAGSHTEAGFLPKFLSTFNSKTHTPINALIFQTLLTCIYVVIGGGFQTLVNFYSIGIWYFYLLCALAVVVLRIKEPDLERPYKTWITVPMVFSSLTIFLLCMPVFAAPLEAAAAFGFIGLSVPIYFISNYVKYRELNIYQHIPSFIKNRMAQRHGIQQQLSGCRRNRKSHSNTQQIPFKFNSQNEPITKEILSRYPPQYKKGAIMPLLDLAQRQNQGWTSISCMNEVAKIVEVPPMRVYEVATFYTMYNREPVGDHLVQVCTTTPCMLNGAYDIMHAIEKDLHVKPGHTTNDKKFTLLEVECLGACSNAPMMQINDHYYEDLNNKSTLDIINQLKNGKQPHIGPQSTRHTCENSSGLTNLTEKPYGPGEHCQPEFQ